MACYTDHVQNSNTLNISSHPENQEQATAGKDELRIRNSTRKFDLLEIFHSVKDAVDLI